MDARWSAECSLQLHQHISHARTHEPLPLYVRRKVPRRRTGAAEDVQAPVPLSAGWSGQYERQGREAPAASTPPASERRRQMLLLSLSF
eukprot:scaffold5732_cov369-Prasinococcus_capsulatus_cf.AAC.1